jgi:hypothetical protein
VSYGSVLRTWAENLLLGASGTTRTLASGRFHLEAADSPDAHPADSVERAVKVSVRPGTNLVPVNPYDNLVYRRHRVVIRVSYALTHAGGDAAETLTEQSGAGTLDAVHDRAATDAHDIETVLVWHENRGGTDPAIVRVLPPDGDLALDVRGDRAVLELAYTVDVQATVPGSYAP